MSYSMPEKIATWEQTYASPLEIGASGSIAINGVQLMVGTVKSITRHRPGNYFEYMAEDMLYRAVEYWFAPEDMEQGYRWSNIDHLSLTKAILAYAGITGIVDDWTPYPTFQMATGPEPFKITTASAWDVVMQLCQITGMFVYTDAVNRVHLSRIWDEPSAVVTRTYSTGDSGYMKSIDWYRSDENLRNRVIVYGYEGCYARADAVSPYVPPDFYKTSIISYEAIVDQAMAQETADINLSRLNKLTQSVTIEAMGNPAYSYLETVTLNDPKIGLSGNWFVYQLEHRYDTNSGYTVRLTASK
jgi:hypothetical protein